MEDCEQDVFQTSLESKSQNTNDKSQININWKTQKASLITRLFCYRNYLLKGYSLTQWNPRFVSRNSLSTFANRSKTI